MKHDEASDEALTLVSRIIYNHLKFRQICRTLGPENVRESHTRVLQKRNNHVSYVSAGLLSWHTNCTGKSTYVSMFVSKYERKCKAIWHDEKSTVFLYVRTYYFSIHQVFTQHMILSHFHNALNMKLHLIIDDGSLFRY